MMISCFELLFYAVLISVMVGLFLTWVIKTQIGKFAVIAMAMFVAFAAAGGFLG